MNTAFVEVVLAVIVAAAVTDAACSAPQSSPQPVVANSTPKPPPDAAVDAPLKGVPAAIAKMSGFRDAMCACADKACVQRITEDIGRWGQELARESEEKLSPTESETKQMAAIAESLAKCMNAARSGSGASP